MAEHNDLGKLGEEKAVAFLQKSGYQIRETNYRYLKGEIDIIAEFQKEIIFVEVKTRSDDGINNPEDAVNTKKKKMLIETACYYLESKSIDLEARFDIISLLLKDNKWKITHLPNAFNSVY